MYQLEVPAGVGPGQQFQAQVGDQMMVITCPQGAGPGSTIQARPRPPPFAEGPSSTPSSRLVPTLSCLVQTLSHAQPLPTQVAGPSVATGVRSNAPPTVTGVPVGGYGNSAYNPGYAGGPNVVLIDAPPEGYVEVDEISPAGWCCLIAGCFFFPLNLLGLCMRERRLVPASHVYY